MSKSTFSRRVFLAATTLSPLAGIVHAQTTNKARVVPKKHSPNEKVNVAGIGVGGKGMHDIMSFKRENIVAICDVDSERAGEAFYRLTDAKQFTEIAKALPKNRSVSMRVLRQGRASFITFRLAE